MNLLFVTSRLPYPPNRGDKVRTFAFLKELSRSHKITLFSFIEDQQENKYREELLKFCDKIVLVHKPKLAHLKRFFLGVLNSLPFQVNYYYFKDVQSIINNIVKDEKIDIIYTHLIRMAPYVKDMKMYKILDYTDAISLEYKRSIPHRKNLISKLFFSIEQKRTKNYEQRIINEFDSAWFISKEDVKYLNLESNKKVKIIPNPIEKKQCKNSFSLKNKIVFVGNMSVPHNISAVKYIAKKLMPNLLKENYLEFHIIGANPTNEIYKLESENIKIIGFVDNLFEELYKFDIFVAPMFYSAGIQNKIVEAMSIGLPVITTKNVANSISAMDNKHLIIAQSEAEYLNSIKKLLDNENLRKNIGISGRKHIVDNFAFNENFHELIKNKIDISQDTIVN